MAESQGSQTTAGQGDALCPECGATSRQQHAVRCCSRWNGSAWFRIDEQPKGFGMINQVADLRERMIKAREEIDALAQKSAARHNESEYGRLCGKREGIGLCLSYLDEMERVNV